MANVKARQYACVPNRLGQARAASRRTRPSTASTSSTSAILAYSAPVRHRRDGGAHNGGPAGSAQTCKDRIARGDAYKVCNTDVTFYNTMLQGSRGQAGWCSGWTRQRICHRLPRARPADQPLQMPTPTGCRRKISSMPTTSTSPKPSDIWTRRRLNNSSTTTSEAMGFAFVGAGVDRGGAVHRRQHPTGHPLAEAAWIRDQAAGAVDEGSSRPIGRSRENSSIRMEEGQYYSRW